jgi:hypothetical protein
LLGSLDVALIKFHEAGSDLISVRVVGEHTQEVITLASTDTGDLEWGIENGRQ